MINIGVNRSFSQRRERLCRESGFSHGLCKGGDKECTAPWFVEMFEEGVVVDPNLFEEEDPPFSAPSSLFVCLVCCALQTRSFSRSEQIHDTISDLRGTILKLGDSCEGKCNVSNFIRFFLINRNNVRVNLTHCFRLQETTVSIGKTWSPQS